MAVRDRDAAMGSAASDDLPRTLRREREARDRAQQSAFAPGTVQQRPSYVPEPAVGEHVMISATTVTDVRIPFGRLVMLCFKLVFAAIPALILLGIMLWTAGHLLMTYFPWLVKVQLLIRVPN